jgi:peroxiredoxin Q/BCP
VSDQLGPGDRAPAFTLTDDTGATVKLSDFAGKRVVLYAYPAAMTAGCTTQACDFRDSLSSLQAAGVEVIGISPDPPAKLARFREKEHLNYTLVSDPDKKVLTKYGAYGEKSSYGRTVISVIRSTFVIGPNGKIEQALYNVRAKGHVARLRESLGV